MARKSSYVGKTHPAKGNNHPGIYRGKKDKSPTPRCIYLSMKMTLPIEYANALQEMYPNVSMYKAIKAFLMENVQPKEI